MIWNSCLPTNHQQATIISFFYSRKAVILCTSLTEPSAYDKLSPVHQPTISLQWLSTSNKINISIKSSQHKIFLYYWTKTKSAFLQMYAFHLDILHVITSMCVFHFIISSSSFSLSCPYHDYMIIITITFAPIHLRKLFFSCD